MQKSTVRYYIDQYYIFVGTNVNVNRQRASGNGRMKNEWWAVGSIAVGTFLLVTTEFLPIGLLSHLSTDLQVSVGVAGLSVTAPGSCRRIHGSASGSTGENDGPPDRRHRVDGGYRRLERGGGCRGQFPGISFGTALGLAVGGLWTFAVAVGRRLVPESAGARATSIISLGISAGTVFGMPVGAILGESIGWRATFAANAVLVCWFCSRSFISCLDCPQPRQSISASCSHSPGFPWPG